MNLFSIYPIEVILDGLLKGTIVLTLAWLGTIALRRSSASARHATWRLAFVGLFVLPALTVLSPHRHLELWGAPEPEAPPRVFPMEMITPGLLVAPSVEAPTTSAVFVDPITDRPAHRAEGGAQTRNPWAMAIAGIWAAGVLYSGIRAMKDLIHVAMITRRAKPYPVARQHIRELGRPVRVLKSDDVAMPMMWGLRRPVVILPGKVEDWSRERLRIVLLHEFAHVERGDYLTHLVVQAACAIYWVNPLVWLAARRLAMEQELACDDHVLSAGTPSQTYARHLLALAQAPVVQGGLPMARPSTLKPRVLALLNPRISRRTPAPRLRVAVILTALAVLMMAPIQPINLAKMEQNRQTRNDAIASLTDPFPEVRRRAAWTLGELENARAVDALVKALRDEVPGVRSAAAWALGEIKDTRAVPPLISSLAESDAVVREMAVRALGEIGDPKAVDPLGRMLADPAPDVRAAAAWALGEIQTGPAIARAVEVLSDSSARVRVTAVDVLSRVDDARQRAGRREVKALRPDVVQGLVTALSDTSPVVRQHAAGALGRLEKSAAVDRLSRLLRDPHAGVRVDAARVLGEIGDAGAVDALLVCLHDAHPDVRAMAVWALDEINVH